MRYGANGIARMTPSSPAPDIAQPSQSIPYHLAGNDLDPYRMDSD